VTTLPRWACVLGCAWLVACGEPEPLTACNVAEQTCQEQVYYAVLRLRGDGWDPFRGLPPIRTISVQQYRADLLGSRPAPDPGKPAPEPKPDPWSKALQLLGLVTPSTSAAQASVDSQVNNVAAFYSPSTGKVTVIDRGRERNDRADTILLAHELVHAFQDKELSGTLASLDTDGGFASRALIEGEAVLYEHLAAEQIEDRSLGRAQWNQYYDGWLMALREGMPDQNSPYFAASWFVYPLGGGLMTAAWLDGGNAAVRRLAGSHPRFSAGYMAAASGESAARYERSVRCRLGASVGGFDQVGADRFGAIQFYAFLARAGLSEMAAWRSALDWRDDRLGVYFDRESERTLVIWRVELADDSAAQATLTELAESGLAEERGLVVQADGAALQVAGSDDSNEWAALLGDALTCP
jgi:hypothetical protein